MWDILIKDEELSKYIIFYIQRMEITINDRLYKYSMLSLASFVHLSLHLSLLLLDQHIKDRCGLLSHASRGHAHFFACFWGNASFYWFFFFFLIVFILFGPVWFFSLSNLFDVSSQLEKDWKWFQTSFYLFFLFHPSSLGSCLQDVIFNIDVHTLFHLCS